MGVPDLRVLVCLAGSLLLIWGPLWFADPATDGLGKPALIRVMGSIVIAAGSCAFGFAAIDHPLVRRRALFWFAVAHTVVWLIAFPQRIEILGPGLAMGLVYLLAGLALILFYLWDPEAASTPRNTVISLFGGAPADSTDRLRSEYEHQIREAAKQEERNRLARDLHDSIKQEIFVIQTSAATVQARFDGDPAGARQALDQVRASARQAMTEMEVMLDQLRAVPLENASLIEALKQHCEALGFRTGARVELKFGNLPPSETLPPGGHEVILRVAQEALANIGRHARASNVLVSLDSSQGHVELRIRDHGAGFDPNQSRRGHGIENMRTRANEFGGQFELASRPGGGTTVTFSIPHATLVEPGVYRRKVIGSAVVLLGLILLLLFSWTRRYAEAVISVMAMSWVLRFAIAYRRAVKRTEVAR